MLVLEDHMYSTNQVCAQECIKVCELACVRNTLIVAEWAWMSLGAGCELEVVTYLVQVC